MKRKCGRPPKQKKDTNKCQMPAANTHTVQPRQAHKNSKTEIISRNLIQNINKEYKMLDRSTVARLGSLVRENTKNHKSNLMTEKYSPLSPQSYSLTPMQTQLYSYKHGNILILRYSLLTPFDPQRLNICHEWHGGLLFL